MAKRKTDGIGISMIKAEMPCFSPNEILVEDYIKSLSEHNFAALSEKVLETHLKYLPGVKIEANPSQIIEGTTILSAGQYSITLRDIFDKPQTPTKGLNTSKYQVEYFDESVISISAMSTARPDFCKNVYLLNDDSKIVGKVKNDFVFTDISIFDKNDTLLYKIEDNDLPQRKWKWLSKCLKEYLASKSKKESGKLILKDCKMQTEYQIGSWERKWSENNGSGDKISIKTFDINFPNSLSPLHKLLMIAGLIAESQLSGRSLGK